MRKTGFILLILTVMSVHAATYYVATDGDDSRTATQAQTVSTPWRTITYAASQVAPGDTVLVRGGTYYEEVVMQCDGVIWQAYPDETPIVDGSVALGTVQPLSSATDFVDPAGVSIDGRFNGNANWASIYKITYPDTDTAMASIQMFTEAGQILANASFPEQSNDIFDDQSTYIPVDASCYGQTAVVITSGRSEPDGYWNGARIQVYVTNNNNNTTSKIVTDWDYDTQTFTLSSALPKTLSSGDSFKLENHWGCLTRPGEVCFTTTSTDGTYTAYIWPNTADDLTDFRVVKHDCGWNFYNGNDDNITVDGFTIQNFCGPYADTSFGIGRAAATSYTMDNCVIKNCTVQNIEGKMAIILGNANGVIVENCTVNNARTGWGIFSRGLSTNRGTDVLIKDCSVNYCRGTNYKFTETDYGQVINCLIGESGTHGDGISVYENCTNIGIYHCRAVNSAIAVAYQGVTNLYVIGNDCQTEWYNMAHWGDSTAGDMIFLNNTMVLGPGVSDLRYGDGFQLSTDSSPGNYIVKNNIFWSTADTLGAGYTTLPNTFDKGYNCFLQTAHHWTAGTGSFENTAPAELFTDWPNTTLRDVTIKDTSAAVYQAGVNVDALIAAIESVFTARGSQYSYDLTVDRNGTDWGDTPSIGAYEYTTETPSENPVDPIEPNDVTDAMFEDQVSDFVLVAGKRLPLGIVAISFYGAGDENTGGEWMIEFSKGPATPTEYACRGTFTLGTTTDDAGNRWADQIAIDHSAWLRTPWIVEGYHYTLGTGAASGGGVGKLMVDACEYDYIRLTVHPVTCSAASGRVHSFYQP